MSDGHVEYFGLAGDQSLAIVRDQGSTHVALLAPDLPDRKVRWETELVDASVIDRPWPMASAEIVAVAVKDRARLGLGIVALDRQSGETVSAVHLGEGYHPSALHFGSTAAGAKLVVFHLETSPGATIWAIGRSGLAWRRILEHKDQARRLSVYGETLVIEGYYWVVALDLEDGRTIAEWKVRGLGCLLADELVLFPHGSNEFSRWSLTERAMRFHGGHLEGLPDGCGRRGDLLVVRTWRKGGPGEALLALDQDGRHVWTWTAPGAEIRRAVLQHAIDFAPTEAAPLHGELPRYLPVPIELPDRSAVLVMLDLDTGQPARVSEARTSLNEMRLYRAGERFVLTWSDTVQLVIAGDTARLVGAFEGVHPVTSHSVASGRVWTSPGADRSGVGVDSDPLTRWKLALGPGW